MALARRRPWSLVGRLTGGVVLIALLSFGVQALVVSWWLKPAVDELAATATEQALNVQTALAAVPLAQRPSLARQLSNERALVLPDEPPERGPPFGMPGHRPSFKPPPALEDRSGQLAARGVTMRLDERGPGSGFAAVFRLPLGGPAQDGVQDVWWFVRLHDTPLRALPGTLALWLVLLALCTAAALWASVRLIARPIAALTAQMAGQRGALQPLPEPVNASAELQQLVRAFNTLARETATAAQSRQQLLAGVSHDLRTPLARLRLRAETQCEPVLAAALTADLFALERIVNQFLAYVQGQGDGPSAAWLGRPAPLAASVRDAVASHTAAGQDVALSIEPPDATSLQRLLPDLAVQRLLCNLIDNALAYGRAPVTVVLRQDAAGPVELQVLDHGPGMSAAEFEHAQQPFVRLTHTRSELGHCGLGLAIVAQVARQLGGRLQLLHEGGGVHGAAPRFGIVLMLPPA